jgi:D-alanyl-D-alanine dipeptidase
MSQMLHDRRASWLPFHPNITVILLTALLLAGCQHRATAPQAAASRQPELVELIQLDPSLHLDIRYASTNNFTHAIVYRQARAFLQRPAAEALVRVHQALKPKGYGLLIFDGYRPWSVTKFFWDKASEHERKIGFVANPKSGSKHNRGCAADLTLFDLATGLEVKMPSAYDEFSERAFANYAGGTAESTQARDLLRGAMEAEGFTVFPAEWWHFDYKDWPQYPILNIPFEKIGNTNAL